jgi:hypothetical protein
MKKCSINYHYRWRAGFPGGLGQAGLRGGVAKPVCVAEWLSRFYL